MFVSAQHFILCDTARDTSPGCADVTKPMLIVSAQNRSRTANFIGHILSRATLFQKSILWSLLILKQ